MYGRTEGYLIQDMDEEQLARKKELCLEHLEVLRLIDPDMIRLNIYAASAHFELHLPLLQVERRDNHLVPEFIFLCVGQQTIQWWSWAAEPISITHPMS